MKLNDKTTHMKRLISITLLVLLTMTTATAQTYYTRFCPDKKLVKEARKWMKSGEWRNGFTAAKPHKSVNAVDFYEQYQKNPEQWKALFRWLSETDVLAIPKGKHPIPGTQLVASVEDSENGPLEKRNSESHFHHIDFQWTVKGTEGFGIIDHMSSTPKDKYKPDVIHYNYDVEKARFYDSNPKEFFIFFPSDWHIAKVATKKEDQTLRVIVIKVDYID
jgi:YhcH/YjgK/YiaL family protein